MEKWRKVEESSGGIKEAFESLSDYVLAIPDVSALGSLLAVDRMAKREMEIGDKFLSDSLEVGRVVNGLEKRGVFIPNNFNLLGKLFYPVFFQAYGIPIPQFEFLGIKSDRLTRDQIRKLSAENGSDLPPLFVTKPIEGHQGERIKVVSREGLTNLKVEEGVVMVQRFWWPRRKSGYVRDVRVVTIDGEPRDFCVRQAKEPLIDYKTGKLIEYPPSLPRVLANVAQGGTVVKVPRRLQIKLFDLAREACSAIRDYAIWMREDKMKVENPQKVNLGLISVDILLGEEGLAVCEVDTAPDLHFFPNVSRLGKSYIDYLKEQTDGGKKPVLLFQKMLGSKVRMPISPELLERFLKQEGVPYIPFRFEFG